MNIKWEIFVVVPLAVAMLWCGLLMWYLEKDESPKWLEKCVEPGFTVLGWLGLGWCTLKGSLKRLLKRKERLLNRERLLAMGFKSRKHLLFGEELVFDFGRNRELVCSGIGGPNEMVWLLNLIKGDGQTHVDSVCVSNFDYEGLMTEEKLRSLLKAFGHDTTI